MPKPEDVRPHKFPNPHVLFDGDGFAVAIGTWEQREPRIAMRWNGEGDDVGYLSQGGNPLWFQLPDYLSIPVLAALIGRDGARNQEIVDALQRLIS